MKPYTYLVGWSNNKKYYYGVRYAINCHPDDLWVKYFTSSSTVKELRKTLGEPDIIQVRQTFVSKEQAIAWETKVLRKMKVVLREDFLNKNDAPAPPVNNRIMTQNTKNKISRSNKGKPKSEEHKQKIRAARAKQDMSSRRGIPLSDEHKQKLREANLGKTFSSEAKAIMNAKRAAHGAPMQGKHHSNETKRKLSEANLGKVMSNETKRKISEAAKKKPILTCPHCGATGKRLSMSRHHFDNCIKGK